MDSSFYNHLLGKATAEFPALTRVLGEERAAEELRLSLEGYSHMLHPEELQEIGDSVMQTNFNLQPDYDGFVDEAMMGEIPALGHYAERVDHAEKEELLERTVLHGGAVLQVLPEAGQ